MAVDASDAGIRVAASSYSFAEVGSMIGRCATPPDGKDKGVLGTVYFTTAEAVEHLDPKGLQLPLAWRMHRRGLTYFAILPCPTAFPDEEYFF